MSEIEELRGRIAKLEEALNIIAKEAGPHRLYRQPKDGESCPPTIAGIAKKALEPGGVPCIPHDIGVQCLKSLEPLDVVGEPNTLLALVRKAMRELFTLRCERNNWRDISSDLGDIHAANAEIIGRRKSSSIGDRRRMKNICLRVVKRMEGHHPEPPRSVEDVKNRCIEAAEAISEKEKSRDSPAGI